MVGEVNINASAFSVEQYRFIGCFYGNIECTFCNVVSNAKITLYIRAVVGRQLEFGIVNSIIGHALWPVGEVAIDGDVFDWNGQCHNAVVGLDWVCHIGH